ncbi:MAG TPA: lantibiotic dehydratase [Streptosporangiaceae bacterium]
MIQAFAASPALSAAVELASPDLARELARSARAAAARSPGDRRRIAIALTGYELRSRHRATPSGLFAGTALIGWAPAAEGNLSSGHRLLLRPGPGWLAGLVAALEADPELADLAPEVRIAAAPALSRIGAAHVRVSRGTGGPGCWQVTRSVRRSRLLDAVLALAGAEREGLRGIRYTELLKLLRVSAVGIEPKELARFITALLREGFLVTDLLPPPGDADPLGHLAQRLAGHPIAAPLRRLRHELSHAPSSPAAADIRRLRDRARAVWPSRTAAGPTADVVPEVVADTILNTGLALPRLVAREIERAASVAWTCAPPLADRPLAGLHRAMLRRYGTDRPVALTELLDLAGSLGLHYPAQAHPAAPSALATDHAARDRLLTGLALDAIGAGRAELCLDRPLRRQLAALAGGVTSSPPPADVFAEIVTASAAALDRGDFLVVLSSPGAHCGPAGSVAGRLAGCFGSGAAGLNWPGPPAAGLNWPGPAAAALPGDEAGPGTDRPVYAEVVFRPPEAAAANLVSETGWTTFRIDLTAHPPRASSRDIALTDLSVIATSRRLMLYCERLGRPVRPVSYSTLHPRRADAVAGLLLALGRDGVAPWRPWDWGAAAAMSWLPRVRVGRAILAPARWALPAGLLLAATSGTDRQWRDGLRRWRDAEELPEVVVAGPWDQRLPLDLADPVHAALLRRECRDRGVTAVTEPPGGVAAWRAAGWPRGTDGPHAAEIVFSLHPRPPRCGPAQRERASLAMPPGLSAARLFLPGGCWLCVNLIVPPALQDDVLGQVTDETLITATARAEVDRWFFVRTEDQAGLPYLVLRYHGPPHGLNATLLPAVHGWGTRLVETGLIREFSLASYAPEVSRYGGEGCMEAAERFFHLDSRRCLATLASMPVPPVRAEVLAAPAILDILAALLGSERVVAELPEPRLSKPERRLFAQLRPLARDTLTAAAGRLWPDWHAALAEYRSRLDGAVRASDPAPVAWSVVHMHCNRLAGLGHSAERVAVALARDLAMTRVLSR